MMQMNTKPIEKENIKFDCFKDHFLCRRVQTCTQYNGTGDLCDRPSVMKDLTDGSISMVVPSFLLDLNNQFYTQML